eukprot:5562893-Amphidinium_carterae.1
MELISTCLGKKCGQGISATPSSKSINRVQSSNAESPCLELSHFNNTELECGEASNHNLCAGLWSAELGLRFGGCHLELRRVARQEGTDIVISSLNFICRVDIEVRTKSTPAVIVGTHMDKVLDLAMMHEAFSSLRNLDQIIASRVKVRHQEG